MFRVAILSKSYWVIGAVAGSVLGQLIPVSMDGIDFCMTALFVIIFIEQWEKADTHFPALAGIVMGLICLFVFGESRFMLPALIGVSALLVLYNSEKYGRRQKRNDSIYFVCSFCICTDNLRTSRIALFTFSRETKNAGMVEPSRGNTALRDYGGPDCVLSAEC